MKDAHKLQQTEFITLEMEKKKRVVNIWLTTFISKY